MLITSHLTTPSLMLSKALIKTSFEQHRRSDELEYLYFQIKISGLLGNTRNLIWYIVPYPGYSHQFIRNSGQGPCRR